MSHPYDLITTEIVGLFVIICVALAQITRVVCRLLLSCLYYNVVRKGETE